MMNGLTDPAYILIVKGDPQTARGAAQSRGIPAQVRSTTEGERETVLRVPAANFDEIIEWFDESSAWLRLHAGAQPAGALLHYRSENVQESFPEEDPEGLDGLDAAPTDIDTFVRDVSDSTIVAIEHAFSNATRLGLNVEGKPLGARALPDTGVPDAGAGWTIEHLLENAQDAEDRYTLAYAWFARQFVRGATGARPGSAEAGSMAPGSFSPEARLGLDLWRLGRNVASEVRGSQDVEIRVGRPDDVIDDVLHSVRTRLNWPALPDDYDPPPPSQWPVERDERPEPPTRVIFRVWRRLDTHPYAEGQVIALFPDIDEGQGLVRCYEHVGQHGAASYYHVIQRTRPARPLEYAALFQELTSPPYNYNLVIRQRR